MKTSSGSSHHLSFREVWVNPGLGVWPKSGLEVCPKLRRASEAEPLGLSGTSIDDMRTDQDNILFYRACAGPSRRGSEPPPWTVGSDGSHDLTSECIGNS